MHIVIVGEDAARAAEFEGLLADFGLDWDIAWLPEGVQVEAGMPAFDVFVCGLSPGAMSGPELLARVAALYPQAVRILLLDQSPDQDSVDIAQGLECAHRVLGRPLDPGELVAAVESVIELRELLDNEALKKTLGRISSLPPPPRLYLQLTRLLRDPEASNQAISQALSQDPAIAARCCGCATPPISPAAARSATCGRRCCGWGIRRCCGWC